MTATPLVSGSVLSVKMGIPSLDKHLLVGQTNSFNPVEFVVAKPFGRCQLYRNKPIFGQLVAIFNVNVGWFMVLATVEENR